MMITLKKAAATIKKKVLVADLNKKLSLNFAPGDDKNAANSKIKTTIITQINPGSWKVANIHPKVLYVTSSSAKETQGSFFKVGIQ